MAVVITHPEMGVYLGNCLGMGFWSLLDPVGQPSAVTFADKDDAAAHIASWENGNDPANYTFIDVHPSEGDYATVGDLRDAGLADILGEMEDDALQFATPMGHA